MVLHQQCTKKISYQVSIYLISYISIFQNIKPKYTYVWKHPTHRKKFTRFTIVGFTNYYVSNYFKWFINKIHFDSVESLQRKFFYNVIHLKLKGKCIAQFSFYNPKTKSKLFEKLQKFQTQTQGNRCSRRVNTTINKKNKIAPYDIKLSRITLCTGTLYL